MFFDTLGAEQSIIEGVVGVSTDEVQGIVAAMKKETSDNVTQGQTDIVAELPVSWLSAGGNLKDSGVGFVNIKHPTISELIEFVKPEDIVAAGEYTDSMFITNVVAIKGYLDNSKNEKKEIKKFVKKNNEWLSEDVNKLTAHIVAAEKSNNYPTEDEVKLYSRDPYSATRESYAETAQGIYYLFYKRVGQIADANEGTKILLTLPRAETIGSLVAKMKYLSSLKVSGFELDLTGHTDKPSLSQLTQFKAEGLTIIASADTAEERKALAEKKFCTSVKIKEVADGKVDNTQMKNTAVKATLGELTQHQETMLKITPRFIIVSIGSEDELPELSAYLGSLEQLAKLQINLNAKRNLYKALFASG